MQSLSLNTTRLCEARDQALAWLLAHAHHCDPHMGATPQEYLFRRKCFNELALLLMLGERLGTPASEDWMRLKEQVARHIDDRYLSLAARRSGTLLMFTCGLGLAVQQGWLDESLSERVRALLGSRFAWGIEGNAFRHLELLTACHYAGAKAPLDVDTVLRSSALALAPSPIHATQDALFALTHAEYYRTLLGHEFSGADPFVPVALSGAMARCLAQGDLDLGLELLETACLRGLALGPEAQALLGQMLPPLLELGRLRPAEPTWVVRDFTAACPAQADWAQSFHLTLVAATCCIALLAPQAPALPSFEPSQLHQIHQLGNALLGLHQYRIESALGALHGCVPTLPVHRRLLDEILDFLQFSQRRDGHFGHLVDELRRAGLDQDDKAGLDRIFARSDRACLDFLAHTETPSRLAA